MKIGIYSIQDSKVGFIAPVVEYSDQSALRNFSVNVDGSALMKKYSNDFTLFKIGIMDTENGIIEPCIPPLNIASASSVMRFDNETE